MNVDRGRPRWRLGRQQKAAGFAIQTSDRPSTAQPPHHHQRHVLPAPLPWDRDCQLCDWGPTYGRRDTDVKSHASTLTQHVHVHPKSSLAIKEFEEVLVYQLGHWLWFRKRIMTEMFSTKGRGVNPEQDMTCCCDIFSIIWALGVQGQRKLFYLNLLDSAHCVFILCALCEHTVICTLTDIIFDTDIKWSRTIGFLVIISLLTLTERPKTNLVQLLIINYYYYYDLYRRP